MGLSEGPYRIFKTRDMGRKAAQSQIHSLRQCSGVYFSRISAHFYGNYGYWPNGAVPLATMVAVLLRSLPDAFP